MVCGHWYEVLHIFVSISTISTTQVWYSSYASQSTGRQALAGVLVDRECCDKRFVSFCYLLLASLRICVRTWGWCALMSVHVHVCARERGARVHTYVFVFVGRLLSAR